MGTKEDDDEANTARCRSLLLTADEKLVAKLLTLCCVCWQQFVY